LSIQPIINLLLLSIMVVFIKFVRGVIMGLHMHLNLFDYHAPKSWILNFPHPICFAFYNTIANK
jgi:uncharacterized membrane protein